MSSDGAYGQHLADALKTGHGESFVSRTTLHNSKIAVTHIRCDVADNKLTAPVENEDAILVMLQLRDWPKRILWADERAVAAAPLKAGAISIFDLRTQWVGHRVCPIHQVNFYLPRASLDEICDLEGKSRISEFDNDPLAGADDQVMWRLGLALLPAFERRNEASQLFIDHVTTAAAAHVLMTYGVNRRGAESRSPRLSRQQAARAKEMIAADLSSELSIAQLAVECGLTLTGFKRAFAKAVGMPPHRWLVEHRLHRAMTSLRAGSLDLEAVATASGFADGGHLVRVFKTRIGIDPLAWGGAIGN